MATQYDRVYYWTGGTENGKWNEAIPNCYPEYKDIDTLLADVTRMGYKAVKGSSKVGSPDGYEYKVSPYVEGSYRGFRPSDNNDR